MATIDKMHRLIANQKVYIDKFGSNGHSAMLPSDQEIKALFMTLLNKYSRPFDFVLDTFAGLLSNAKFCLSIPLHRLCICFHFNSHLSTSVCGNWCKGMKNSF